MIPFAPTKVVLQFWPEDADEQATPAHAPESLEKWATRNAGTAPGTKDSLSLARPDEPWIALVGIPYTMEFGHPRPLIPPGVSLQACTRVEPVPDPWQEWVIRSEDTDYQTVACIKGKASGLRCFRWAFRQTAVCKCWLLGRSCGAMEAGRCKYHHLCPMGNDPQSG